MVGIASLITHLATTHTRLRTSVFTCPTCVKAFPCTWNDFCDHFVAYHHAASALLVVLDETCVHSRTAWGLALQAFITTIALTGDRMAVNVEEDVRIFCNLGGAVARCEGDFDILMKGVTNERIKLLPKKLVDLARERYRSEQQRRHAAKAASYAAVAAQQPGRPAGVQPDAAASNTARIKPQMPVRHPPGLPPATSTQASKATSQPPIFAVPSVKRVSNTSSTAAAVSAAPESPPTPTSKKYRKWLKKKAHPPPSAASPTESAPDSSTVPPLTRMQVHVAAAPSASWSDQVEQEFQERGDDSASAAAAAASPVAAVTPDPLDGLEARGPEPGPSFIGDPLLDELWRHGSQEDTSEEVGIAPVSEALLYERDDEETESPRHRRDTESTDYSL
jgi:hypothetical protein